MNRFGTNRGPNAHEFEEMMLAARELAEYFPEGLVYIGGVAVYLHATCGGAEQYAEFTHDGDFYISTTDFADLRDIEEVVANRRLSKHQLVKRGFEFDIYTERRDGLIVPYQEILAHSQLRDGFRIADLNHLLPLKLEAFADRRGSAKGAKDARDLLRISEILAITGQRLSPDIASRFCRAGHAALLAEVLRGPAAMDLAQGNSQVASQIRGRFDLLVADYRRACEPRPTSGPDAGPQPP